MIKLSKSHTLYEVWCEHTAESVFVSRKPTKPELEELRRNADWPEKEFDGSPLKLKVFKLKPFYELP